MYSQRAFLKILGLAVAVMALGLVIRNRFVIISALAVIWILALAPGPHASRRRPDG